MAKKSKTKDTTNFTDEQIQAKMEELYNKAGYTATIAEMEPEAQASLKADAIRQLEAVKPPEKPKPIANILGEIFGIKTKGLEKQYAVPQVGGKDRKPDGSVKFIRIGNKLFYDKPELKKKDKNEKNLVEAGFFTTLTPENVNHYKKKGLIF